MKRIIFLIFSIIFICSFCGCANNSAAEFTPNNTGIVVYPDQETADTINGYLQKEEVPNKNIGKPLYDGNLNTDNSNSEYLNIDDGNSNSESSITENYSSESIYNSNYYYANINSHKFHYPDCRYAQKMNSTSIRIEYDYDKLINEGYVPCKVCKP